MVKWSVYICDLSSYLYDGHHIIGDNGSGKNVPAHLRQLGVVQRHRHHLGDVCLFFLQIFLYFLKMKRNLGEVADACVHRHVGTLLQEEKLPASVNPIIKYKKNAI